MENTNKEVSWYQLYSTLIFLSVMSLCMWYFGSEVKKINTKLDTILQKEVNVNLNDTTKILILKK